MKCFAPVVAALAGAAFAEDVVSLKFHKVQLPPDLVQITRRATAGISAINNITGGGYYSELKVGTPPQTALLLLDTGSSDTWVVSNTADLCNSRSAQRLYGFCTPTYDSDASSTYKLVTKNGFDITYLDGRTIRGDYISESLTIDDQVVPDQQIGLALRTVRGTGIMGLGFTGNVATRKTYPTILDSMVKAGYIGRKAYSLYLNDLSSSEGTLLFGGIDTEKYIGSLKTIPIIRDAHSLNHTSYSVAMTRVSLEDADGVTALTRTSFNASTVLDSGSTLSLMPATIATALWKRFEAEVVEDTLALVDCKWRGPDGHDTFFEFDFDGAATIRVPLEEMVVDNLDPILDQLTGLVSFDRPCMFGIQSAATFGISGSDFALLGDTFLRSAYVVYDETNLQVGIAQANLNSTKSNIIVLGAAEKAFPTATGVASQITTSPTETGGPGGPTGAGGPGGTTANPTSTGAPNAAGRPGVGSGMGMDGLGVAFVVALCSLVGAATFLI